MNVPRAVGVRAPYAAMPERVRAWVDETLGSPVVEAAEQTGGMSPGCATRLVCADGSRAFVKAVGPELNPDTPTLFRRERAVLEMLGRHELWAQLLAAYDDGDWVALLLEDVEGTPPDLDDDATMSRLLSETDALTQELGRRDVPNDPLIDTLASRFRIWADALDDVDRIPGLLVPGWVREAAPELAVSVRALADGQMDRLVHWDIRNDNLLQRPDGSLVFVDWGGAHLGPPWADPLLARLERVEHPWFDDHLMESPALAALGDDGVTAWLAGFGTFLAFRSTVALDVNLPTLQAFRLTESRRAFTAAARRLGV
ncbi:MAG: phosphotransferase [Nocardioides sp.]|nr:phosphotransferase [Nocardioides sp.]